MKDSLDRKPLAARLAEAVAIEIHEGRWPGEIPGYRVLAGHFDVSWRTAQSALKLLEKSGLLRPPCRGRPRQAVTPPDHISRKNDVLLVITSSKAPADAGEQGLLDELMLKWVSQGGRVRRAQVDYLLKSQPASTLTKLVNAHAPGAVVIREPARPWVSAAMKLDKPVYFLGGDISPEDFPLVSGFAVSIRHMVAAVVERLRRLGHERILIPDEGRGKSYREGVLLGLRKGFGDTAPLRSYQSLCPVFAEMEPEAWQRYWDDAFRRINPTAAIVHKEASFLSLHGFCYRRGLRIPDDVSVVCLSASENLPWCHPPPDHVTFPQKRALGLFQRWITKGFPVTGLQILPAGYVDAGSVRRL